MSEAGAAPAGLSVAERLGLTGPGRCGRVAGDSPFGCGAAGGPETMPFEIWQKVKQHPCYSEEAHHHYARMHVAVAPACNIQCNYCNRKYDCSNESRPGVASERLTPEQAERKVLAVASRMPQMTVLGIAGPGDALANPQATFETFRRVRDRAPDIILCLSTNGLALPRYVDELVALRVKHVTITINTLDPAVGENIYAWVLHEGRRLRGVEAARLLIERQLRGLELLTERGVLAKINSVLIPGLNDADLVRVNREVKARGAFLHNIMPLISDPAHGTVFGLGGRRGPTARELKAVQDACAGGANLMRHCRQCRADAVGLLGDDRGAEFTIERVGGMDFAYDLEARRAYQEQVEAERQAQRAARGTAMAAAQMQSGEDVTALVAVASRGGGRINQHFGHASEFQIYEVGTRAGITCCTFVGHRRVDRFCQGGYGDDEQVPSIVGAINDCHAVLVARIGACPRDELKAAGIEAVDGYAFEFIEQGLLGWFDDYRRRVARGETPRRPDRDARLR